MNYRLGALITSLFSLASHSHHHTLLSKLSPRGKQHGIIYMILFTLKDGGNYLLNSGNYQGYFSTHLNYHSK